MYRSECQDDPIGSSPLSAETTEQNRIFWPDLEIDDDAMVEPASLEWQTDAIGR